MLKCAQSSLFIYHNPTNIEVIYWCYSCLNTQKNNGGLVVILSFVYFLRQKANKPTPRKIGATGGASTMRHRHIKGKIWAPTTKDNPKPTTKDNPQATTKQNNNQEFGIPIPTNLEIYVPTKNPPWPARYSFCWNSCMVTMPWEHIWSAKVLWEGVKSIIHALGSWHNNLQ